MTADGGIMASATGQRKSRSSRSGVTQTDALREQAVILFATNETLPPDQPRRTDQSIADELGVSRSSITRWKRDAEFRAMVQDAKAKIRADALRLPISQVHERIRTLDRITAKLVQGIDLRAATYKAMAQTPEEAAREMFGDATPPWAATGVYVAKKKISASGKVVTDWEPDTATIREIRANYEHVAKQLEQWEENVNLNHAMSEYHDDRLDALTIEQLEAIDRILSSEG